MKLQERRGNFCDAASLLYMLCRCCSRHDRRDATRRDQDASQTFGQHSTTQLNIQPSSQLKLHPIGVANSENFVKILWKQLKLLYFDQDFKECCVYFMAFFQVNDDSTG